MSTLEAFLIIAAVLAFSVPAAYWQIGRARRAGDAERARAIEEGSIRGSFAPAARPVSETRPGTDLAEQDALELLYSIPAHDPELGAGRARLEQAIDDDRTNQGEA